MASKTVTETTDYAEENGQVQNNGNPTPPNSPVAAPVGTPESIEIRRKSFPKRVVFSPPALELPMADPVDIKPKFFRQNTPFKTSAQDSRLTIQDEFVTPRMDGGRKSSSPNLDVHKPMASPGISPICSEEDSPSFEEFKNLFTDGKPLENLNRFIDDDELIRLTTENESDLSIYNDSHSFLNRNVTLEDGSLENKLN